MASPDQAFERFSEPTVVSIGYYGLMRRTETGGRNDYPGQLIESTNVRISWVLNGRAGRGLVNRIDEPFDCDMD